MSDQGIFGEAPQPNLTPEALKQYLAALRQAVPHLLIIPERDETQYALRTDEISSVVIMRTSENTCKVQGWQGHAWAGPYNVSSVDGLNRAIADLAATVGLDLPDPLIVSPGATSPFPPPSAPRLTRDDVIGYLMEVQGRGWPVTGAGNRFQIALSVTDALTIEQQSAPNTWLILVGNPGRYYRVGAASDVVALMHLIEPHIGGRRPTSVRLYESEPATVYSKLANLMGASQLEAVFDPYLEDKSLDNLRTIIGLANATVSPQIRLLTASDQVRIPKSGIPKLSKPYVDSWLKELHATRGEVRHYPHIGHNRRFLLLSGGQSLLFGMSLNAPAKNETAHLESDAEDRRRPHLL